MQINAATPGLRLRVVEHLKRLRCLWLMPERAMIAVTPVLQDILPQGWSRMALLETDAAPIGFVGAPPPEVPRAGRRGSRRARG
ncbi:MAG: hypothetical protein ACREDA_10430 [Methylocella sp.]